MIVIVLQKAFGAKNQNVLPHKVNPIQGRSIRGSQQGENFNPSLNFQTQISLKKCSIHTFLWLVLFDSNLVLRHLRVPAGHYSQPKFPKYYRQFITGYQIFIGQRTFFALGLSLEIPQSHVTAYVIICNHQKLKLDNFQVW